MLRTGSWIWRGDALFEADGSRLWAGHGPRTDENSLRQLTDLWDVEVVPLRLVDPRFYHLDTGFCPLSHGEVMYYPAAFFFAAAMSS